MNQVSDLKLAIAAYDAGIVPSLVIPHIRPGGIDEVKQQLIGYINHTGNCNLILALPPKFFTPEVIKLIIDCKVSHIELLENIESHHIPILQLLKNIGVKIILKLVFFTEEPLFVQGTNIDAIPFFDALDIKGPDGASRVMDTDENLMQRYKKIRTKYPDMPIIVTGGISTSEQIKEFLDNGVAAVSLGTPFAMSEESCINYDKKMAIINMSFKDVNKVKAGSMYQNAIVFTPTPDTDDNNSVGLIVGRDSPNKGLIFVGKGIDNITSIKPVSQIVKELTYDVQV